MDKITSRVVQEYLRQLYEEKAMTILASEVLDNYHSEGGCHHNVQREELLSYHGELFFLEYENSSEKGISYFFYQIGIREAIESGMIQLSSSKAQA